MIKVNSNYYILKQYLQLGSVLGADIKSFVVYSLKLENRIIVNLVFSLWFPKISHICNF